MVSNASSVNYDNLGEVTTAIDAWLENETGSTATLCVRTRVWSTADGVTGWGIIGQAGYNGNNDAELIEVGRGVINYADVAVDGTAKWTVNKTHEGWTATCLAKSLGGVVDNREAYPLENEVTCLIDIPATTSYVVSYNANGGTGAPSNQTKWHGETLILSNAKPTKTGHTFKGWGTSADDTTVNYASGASYTGNAALSLYAIWQPNTWPVTYNPNGGTGAPEDQTKVYGQTLVLSSTSPTRTGYTFKGWATTANGTVAYQPGNNYTENKALALYAVWEIRKYTISYNANGGTGAPATQTKEYGKSVTISDGNLFKDKHRFLGWATSATGNVVYHAGDVYSNNANLSLYAVWERMGIMRILNDNLIYDEACREQITGVVTAGTGDEYTATVKGVEALAVGVGFTMIPHVISTSTSPTLNVNGLGAKNIRQRVSNNTSTTVVGSSANWLAANKPVKVIYDGTYWIVDVARPNAAAVYGTLPIANGGTGATTASAALNNLGITWGTAEAPATGTPNTIYIQIN